MRNVRRKLNSKRGVTIVMALLFFVIAAIIGSIVITAASASLGRLSHIHNEQQAYLTVSSAAKLARGEVNGIKCTFIKETVGSKPPTMTYEVAPSSAGLSEFILAVCKSHFDGMSPSESFTISSAKASIAAVNASVVEVKTGASGINGTLIIKLSSADDENPYVMTLSVPFSIWENEASVTETEDADDDDNDGEPDGPSTTTTTVTVTTIYSFGSGTITKGEPTT